MTEKPTNLSNKICHICTGCGRCSGVMPDITIVSGTTRENYVYPQVDAKDNECMIAVDVGTTTIVMQLRRIFDGEILDTYKEVNPQRKYGADVLSRIQAAENADCKKEMQQLIVAVLKRGINQFEQRKDQISKMIIAANTTMVYLLMGFDTAKIGVAPFIADHLEEIETTIHNIKTTIISGISSFVGGDIVAGLYTEELYKRESIGLFIDLGTNGEMALGSKEKILATATAAGPAFEGRATAGIWGADMILLTATLLKKGIVDETGLLAEPYFETGIDIGGVHITQQDIRSLQMAKAAIFAGIQTLCKKYGVKYNEIQKVYLAGGFGYFLNPDAAVEIGLLPKELKEKVVAVGNTALEGAFLYGRESSKAEMTRILNRTKDFNLAMEEGFNDAYIEALNLL